MFQYVSFLLSVSTPRPSSFLLPGVTSAGKGASCMILSLAVSLHFPSVTEDMFLPVCITSWWRDSLWLAVPLPTTLGYWPIKSVHITDRLQTITAPGGVRTRTHACSAHYHCLTFSMSSYIPCTKGVTANLYGGTYKHYGGFCPALAI